MSWPNGVALGAALGTVLAFYVVPLGAHAWQLSAIFSATYIGGSMNYAAAAEAVGQTATPRRPDHRPDEHRADHDLLQLVRQGEALFDEQDRPGDHPGVVAEQQAAQSGHGHVQGRRTAAHRHPVGTANRIGHLFFELPDKGAFGGDPPGVDTPAEQFFLLVLTGIGLFSFGILIRSHLLEFHP